MLPEQAVASKWSLIFKGGQVTPKAMRAAAELIDQLPPESPLRVRLSDELRELRHIAAKGDNSVDSKA